MGEELKKEKKANPRKRKRTKAQEERRATLLSRILDKWVYVKYNDGVEDNYVFLKHRMQNENSTSKIEQIMLSGDPLYDGIYLITDYDIDLVFDIKEGIELIDLKMKRFDLKVGLFAEEDITETLEELKARMIGAKYLTEDEFKLYCQSTKRPPGIKRMLLSAEGHK
jgi:hypothetical protein